MEVKWFILLVMMFFICAFSALTASVVSTNYCIANAHSKEIAELCRM